MKKILVLMLALALVLGSLAGCTKETETGTTDPVDKTPEPAKEMVLKWNLGSDPKTIDPQLNSASDGGDVINNTFEGLYREIDGVLEPAIAESHTVSDDKMTYTFKLKQTLWSDGTPVTAHDFEYAWKRAIDPATASEYAFIFYYIKNAKEFADGAEGVTMDDIGVKATDDYTLEVQLKTPTPYFVNLTAFFSFMPTRKDVVESGDGWAKNPSIVVSNGPFKLTDYKLGEKFVFEKNENYWNADKVKLDKIEAMMIVEASTTLTAYEAGELDVIDTVPSEEIPRLLVEDDTFTILPMIGTYYYIFNVTEEKLKDPNVRKALTLAIDRKSIVETVTKGGQIPATGFVPPTLTLSDGKSMREVVGNFGIDPDKALVDEAKALMEAAGYSANNMLKLNLLHNTSEGHRAVAEAVQAMWKEIYVDVEIANQDWAVFQETRHQGEFEVARGGWIGDYTDPMTFLDMWLSYSHHNDAQWKHDESPEFTNSKKFDELIEGSYLVAGKERDDMLIEAEKTMFEDWILAPIYYYTDSFAIAKNAKNVQKTILNKFWFGYAEMAD